MKQLTEAQVMGFRGAMVPPTRRKHRIEHELTSIEHQDARTKTATRRAIEEYHELRARRLEMEL